MHGIQYCNIRYIRNSEDNTKSQKDEHVIVLKTFSAMYIYLLKLMKIYFHKIFILALCQGVVICAHKMPGEVSQQTS